ncbi:hypothetical protein Plhal703r1_c07g0041961 [Plasmopara halstedii]
MGRCLMVFMLLVTTTLHASAIASTEPHLATSSVLPEHLQSHELGESVKERSLKAEEDTTEPIDREERVSLTESAEISEKVPEMLNKAGISTHAEEALGAKVMEAVEDLKGAADARPKVGYKAEEVLKDKKTSRAPKEPTTTVNAKTVEDTPVTDNVKTIEDAPVTANVKPTGDPTGTVDVNPPNIFQRLINKIKKMFAKLSSWFRWKKSKPSPQESTVVNKDTEITPTAHSDNPKPPQYEPKSATEPTTGEVSPSFTSSKPAPDHAKPKAWKTGEVSPGFTSSKPAPDHAKPKAWKTGDVSPSFTSSKPAPDHAKPKARKTGDDNPHNFDGLRNQQLENAIHKLLFRYSIEEVNSELSRVAKGFSSKNSHQSPNEYSHTSAKFQPDHAHGSYPFRHENSPSTADQDPSEYDLDSLFDELLGNLAGQLFNKQPRPTNQDNSHILPVKTSPGFEKIGPDLIRQFLRAKRFTINKPLSPSYTRFPAADGVNVNPSPSIGIHNNLLQNRDSQVIHLPYAPESHSTTHIGESAPSDPAIYATDRAKRTVDEDLETHPSARIEENTENAEVTPSTDHFEESNPEDAVMTPVTDRAQKLKSDDLVLNPPVRVKTEDAEMTTSTGRFEETNPEDAVMTPGTDHAQKLKSGDSVPNPPAHVKTTKTENTEVTSSANTRESPPTRIRVRA